MNLTVLGATGSIGASTLDVVSRHPDRYRVLALTAHAAVEPLLALCRSHRPRYAVLSGVGQARDLEKRFSETGTELLFGAAALEEVVMHDDCQAVMAAIVGAAGLPATLAAAAAGRRVLLANKEALVMAGPLFMRAAHEAGATLLPIDSEHNAVFQCLSGNPLTSVRRIVLTASGGPFRALPIDGLDAVTPEQACAHPNWVMGRKISVDSATMMNKALEVIEARWLFDLQPEQIRVVVHPQSIVHSMVVCRDNSVLAQMGTPDMRVPIAFGLSFPQRIESGASQLDFSVLGALTFEAPDFAPYPGLLLACEPLRGANGSTTVLNAANEEAVAAFLAGSIRFDQIHSVNADALASAVIAADEACSIDGLIALDQRARRQALQHVARLAR